MSQRPGSSNSVMAEKLAKQGLGVGTIRRWVTFEFGTCPSDARLNELVAIEARKRDRLRKRYG